MLRIERIFEEAGIQDELDTYNPLVPDGNNWKATMQVEYEDVEERKRALARLKGIEDRVWIKIEGQPRVYAIADEDLERESDQKTSSVHFLRFELAPAMISALKAGSGLAIGVDHPQYSAALDPVADATRSALLATYRAVLCSHPTSDVLRRIVRAFLARITNTACVASSARCTSRAGSARRHVA